MLREHVDTFKFRFVILNQFADYGTNRRGKMVCFTIAKMEQYVYESMGHVEISCDTCNDIDRTEAHTIRPVRLLSNTTGVQ